MAISEKNENLSKNKCIHLATITANLALGQLSEVSYTSEYVPPRAAFFLAANCIIPVDCEIEAVHIRKGKGGAVR